MNGSCLKVIDTFRLAVREKEVRAPVWTNDDETAFNKLVEYLEDKGCTRKEAEADLKQWNETMPVAPEGLKERSKYERERILRRKATNDRAKD